MLRKVVGACPRNVQLAQHVRYLRAGMLDVLKMDYIRTARGKGLGERAVIYKHAFKNAAIPLVTMTGLQELTLMRIHL